MSERVISELKHIIFLQKNTEIIFKKYMIYFLQIKEIKNLE